MIIDNIETKHICKICGMQFDEDELERAREHGRTKKIEGDYEGIVALDANAIGNGQFIFLTKSERFGYNLELKYHEQIYNLSHVNNDLRQIQGALAYSTPLKQLGYYSIWKDEPYGWHVSEIGSFIKDRKLKAVSKEDLSEINELVSHKVFRDSFIAKYKGVWRTLY